MDTQTVIVSGITGIVTSAITAYLTAHLKMKAERDKWDRELKLKYAETAVANRGVAQGLATQFAVGFLVVRHADGKRDKVFVPRGGRLTIGRKIDSDIEVRDPQASREAAMIESQGSSVFLIDLHHRHGTFLNGVRLDSGSRSELNSGDVITVGGDTQLIFQSLVGSG